LHKNTPQYAEGPPDIEAKQIIHVFLLFVSIILTPCY